MGYGHCGTDSKGREIGYLIDAVCDQPGCNAEIDRGMAYVCGDDHGGGLHGCGGYFCPEHRFYASAEQSGWHLCATCFDKFKNPKPLIQPSVKRPIDPKGLVLYARNPREMIEKLRGRYRHTKDNLTYDFSSIKTRNSWSNNPEDIVDSISVVLSLVGAPPSVTVPLKSVIVVPLRNLLDPDHYVKIF